MIMVKWEKTANNRWVCPYAENVSCSTRECNKCGWNPKVAEQRKEAYLQKQREKER